MKILLANSYFLERDSNELKIMKPYPPLGLLYVTAVLKEAGHTVEVFDGTFNVYNDFKGASRSFFFKSGSGKNFCFRS